LLPLLLKLGVKLPTSIAELLVEVLNRAAFYMKLGVLKFQGMHLMPQTIQLGLLAAGELLQKRVIMNHFLTLLHVLISLDK
jgi:hypothetical protein